MLLILDMYIRQQLKAIPKFNAKCVGMVVDTDYLVFVRKFIWKYFHKTRLKSFSDEFPGISKLTVKRYLESLYVMTNQERWLQFLASCMILQPPSTP